LVDHADDLPERIFIIGVQLSLNAFITGFYPTSIRGTGVGWSQVVGRSGSLIVTTDKREASHDGIVGLGSRRRG
jgi:hypothetical protein